MTTARRGLSGAGNAPRIVRTLVVALYDAESGRIHHVHTVYEHEGAARVDEEVTVERAREHARALGHDVEQLKVVVSPRPEHGSTPHRIDTNSGDFVPLHAEAAS